jgi:hypothetical protein
MTPSGVSPRGRFSVVRDRDVVADGRLGDTGTVQGRPSREPTTAVRIYRAVARAGAAFRDVGIATLGVMPPLRSSDGTYGTQVMQARERAKERRRRYPR